MPVRTELPECPVALTASMIGAKWKLLIMRDLMDGSRRFSELHRSLVGISQKVLTENLRAMERDGLLTRTVFPEVPPRVEYALSELGLSLRPVIEAMRDWGIACRKRRENAPSGDRAPATPPVPHDSTAERA